MISSHFNSFGNNFSLLEKCHGLCLITYLYYIDLYSHYSKSPDTTVFPLHYTPYKTWGGSRSKKFSILVRDHYYLTEAGKTGNYLESLSNLVRLLNMFNSQHFKR